MGLTRFLNFKNMIKALERKDYARASIEMRDSLWYRQNTNRVEQLAVWMDCGQFPQ